MDSKQLPIPVLTGPGVEQLHDTMFAITTVSKTAKVKVRIYQFYTEAHCYCKSPVIIRSVTCHLAVVTFPDLPQPKLVLDLATLDGCEAELTWVVVISQDSLPTKNDHVSQNNRAVS